MKPNEYGSFLGGGSQGQELHVPDEQGRSYDGEAVNVALKRERDMILARQTAQALAVKLGFSKTEVTLIASVISDLAREIFNQGSTGEMELKQVRQEQKIGIQLSVKASSASLSIFRMPQNHDSSSGSSTLELRGFARYMDEVIITYASGESAAITAIKWRR
jgi:serine/threonine-protein kinase RsbT